MRFRRPAVLSLLASIPFCAFCVAGCPKHSTDSRESGAECGERLNASPLALAPPPPLATPVSHLTVEVSAEVAALERELSKQIPTVLAAEERRPVGSPGEVTYTVRRGKLDLKLDGDRLAVGVPVDVDVEVCKPLGPFCPTYGSCNPRLSAVASIPILLGADYGIGKSRVGISLVRGCVIAGFDASSEIKKNAAQQIGNVQQRIDRSTPDIRSAVANAWELLHHPVALGTTTCVRITPTGLAQAKPRNEAGALRSRIVAKGTLAVEEPCAKSDAPVKAPPLPPLETSSDVPEGVEFQVPIRIDWPDVSRALTRSLVTKDTESAPLRIVKIEARATSEAGRGLVALNATLAGQACGDLWLIAEPWYDTSTSRLRLRGPRLAPGQPEPRGLAALLADLENRAAAPLPIDITGAPNALTELVRGFGKDLPKSVALEVEIKPPDLGKVVLDEKSLVPVAVLRGTARVAVK